MALRLRVRITGANEVLRALRALGPDAERELRSRMEWVSIVLAERIRSAGQTDSRQSARAARSVRALQGRTPVISAGAGRAAKGVLFGSEFGAKRRFGWYAHPRYQDSPARQFRPHRGASSYWFFATAERNQAWVARQWHAIAEAVIRDWSA